MISHRESLGHDRIRLQIEGLSHSYDGVSVLERVDLGVSEGEVVGLVGPNGAGKTTLLNAISGFIRFRAGTVFLNGNKIGGLPPHRIARLGIGRLFQDIRLFPRLNATNNVLIAFQRQRGENPMYSIWASSQVQEIERRNLASAIEIAHTLGIGFDDGRAEVLSYGEQKLLAVARLLASGARLLLLDEMSAGVSSAMRPKLAAALRNLASSGCAILLCEHDLAFLADVCSRVSVLDGGRVVANGAPREILDGAFLRRVLYGV
jgi:ABC-type branched-subunit amino acid transport system ATPase component